MRIAVLGGGSWGTALAAQARRLERLIKEAVGHRHGLAAAQRFHEALLHFQLKSQFLPFVPFLETVQLKAIAVGTFHILNRHTRRGNAHDLGGGARQTL